ncbi:carboxypeptidase-like regulatory domain-containing protein [Terriglobus roseus]|nr:carboxypeptidase-like regulatory domain-containing protein [Terriglobus roseus]
MKRLLRTLRTALTVTALLVPATLLLHPAHAAGQAATFRSVTGDVTSKGGAKVKGAVVHLKDTKSLSQRSYITADDGQFKFGQLSTGTDYEVWADLNGEKSAVKTLSSFDNKNAMEISLKMPN